MTDTHPLSSKICAYCLQDKPLSEFRRRTGKRSKGQSRRGACRDCRKQREVEARKTLPVPSSLIPEAPPAAKPKPRSSPRRSRSGTAVPVLPELQPLSEGVREPSPPVQSSQEPQRSLTSVSSTARRLGAEQRRPYAHPRGPKPDPQDFTALVPSAQGMILMRGHSDKGRRWHQEIDLELAAILVKEHAAVVVNRRTIRRLFSNRDFRSYILTRDRYICHFCGLYGDTIDHLLPRAKGGHTTPVNCVCACNLCNQTKADQYVEEFMGR
ncbi:HNH endonuclease [Paenibacillus wynnii]|uniref:HNH endonuclease n=1 Tax=Paenibacillus wynnii TaxID=268407 RepID=UPI0027D77956|nr:HNH endonuclease [Paenibacillus wynnii]